MRDEFKRVRRIAVKAMITAAVVILVALVANNIGWLLYLK